ncbi:MAG: class I SAM-dependent methyltransferase [Planctomycetes bacterium]|nr:class I SAM-dependent methyltransferase [Planctomycetota bacterium]
MSDRTRHWELIYRDRSPERLGWFEPEPSHSLALIAATGVGPGEPILDVGAGAARLVEHLLDRGYTDLTALDLVAMALDSARARLGPRAERITWLVDDVTRVDLGRRFAVWHDRAVFHFLTDAADRARYVAALRSALLPHGHVILATFAPDGPASCSGLPVQRYDGPTLVTALGPGFVLREERRVVHRTPHGGEQRFCYARLQGP